MKRWAAIFVAAAILAVAAPGARSQMTMMGIGPGAANTTPPVACTNQLVLDYSNSCALIGQAWGQ